MSNGNYSQVYFQGTDETLWACDIDGNNAVRLGGWQTASRPVAFGDYIYFVAPDGSLCKGGRNGQGLTTLASGANGNTPCVSLDYVYYVDAALDSYNVCRAAQDGSGAQQLGYAVGPNSGIFLKGDYLYFQGTDNQLWRISLDGSSGTNLGGWRCLGAPFLTDDFMFFVGTSQAVFRTDLNGQNPFEYNYQSTVQPYNVDTPIFANDTYIYFRGTDNAVWQVPLDGNNGQNLGGYKCGQRPTATDQYVFFPGIDNALWRLNLDGTNGTFIGGFRTHTRRSSCSLRTSRYPAR